MTIQEAKSSLEDEVKDFPYTYDDPFGNAGSYRKLIDFLYTSIMSNELNSEEAKDWLFELYDKQDEKEKLIFQDRVDVIMTALDRLKNDNKLK